LIKKLSSGMLVKLILKFKNKDIHLSIDPMLVSKTINL
jgi:hypothetical protein